MRSKIQPVLLVLALHSALCALPCADLQNRHYMVAIYNNDEICDGFLIHLQWVLMGVDCLNDRLGFRAWKYVRTATQPFQVRKIAFSRRCATCGWVLIRLVSPFKPYGNVDVVHLPRKNQKLSCAVSEYMFASFTKWAHAENKLQIKCGKVFKFAKTICWKKEDVLFTSDSICGNFELPAVCKGLCDTADYTGGALVCNGILFGFLNYSTCGERKKGFANVAKTVSWIRDTQGIRSEGVKASKNSTGKSGSLHARGSKVLIAASLVLLLISSLHIS